MRSLKTLYTLAGSSVATLSLLAASTAHAATLSSNTAINPNGSADFSDTGTSFTDLFTSFANNALNVILLIAGVVAVFYLIWSGFQYITAGGSPDKAKAARTGIINAVIGIVIIVAAFVIIRFAVGLGNSASTGSGF